MKKFNNKFQLILRDNHQPTIRSLWFVKFAIVIIYPEYSVVDMLFVVKDALMNVN